MCYHSFIYDLVHVTFVGLVLSSNDANKEDLVPDLKELVSGASYYLVHVC